jgi:two-component sensor histidine kinase
VNISWGTDGHTFTMRWTERNGPPVSTPKRRGFGTIVMEAMIARSVDGTVGLDYAPPGVTWRLTCPAANVLEHMNVSEVLVTTKNRNGSATAGKVRS